MEVAKRVKKKLLYSDSDSRPSIGVKVVRKKPGKVSLAGVSKTKGIKKQIKAKDKVAIPTEQKEEPKNKKAKTTKNTKTDEAENGANDTEAENKLEATKTKAKKPKGLEKTKKTTEGTDTAAGTSKSEVPKKKPKAVNKVKKTEKTEKTDKRSKLIEEVYEAITKHGEPRKGASSQAIKNYIFSKRGIENEDASHQRVNKLINNALKKAIENGDLARPTSSKGNQSMPSATGRFLLPKKATKVPKKPKLKEDSESME